MKILINSMMIVMAAAIGLAVGFALKSTRTAQASDPATGRLAASDASRRNAMKGSSENPRVQPNDDSPLATKLEHDISKSTGVTRWLCWLEAIEKATATDFPRLARLAQNNPAALQFVTARWAEIAPRHLFDSLVAAAK